MDFLLIIKLKEKVIMSPKIHISWGIFHDEQECVPHCGLAIYIKRYLKAKEELRKLKYFTMQKYIYSSKNPLKETKIFQDILTLV
jgi:hypothetical protein